MFSGFSLEAVCDQNLVFFGIIGMVSSQPYKMVLAVVAVVQ